MTVYDALRAITQNSSEKSLSWAVNYAQCGLELPEGEELRIQCLYVLNNISRWRGELGKQVRETLKSYTKGV